MGQHLQTDNEYEADKLLPYESSLRKAKEYAEKRDFKQMCYYNDQARKIANKEEIDIEYRISQNINLAHGK